MNNVLVIVKNKKANLLSTKIFINKFKITKVGFRVILENYFRVCKINIRSNNAFFQSNYRFT